MKRIWFSLFLLFPTLCFSADFDCKHAASFDEHVICSNPALSKQDEEINKQYKFALQFVGKPAMEAIGREFLFERHSCGTNEQCVGGIQRNMLSAYSLINSWKIDIDSYNRLSGVPIPYGPKDGQVVRIVGTWIANNRVALVGYKHLLTDAVAYCKQYEPAAGDDCINREMKSVPSGVLTGNCLTGEFESLSGVELYFQGRAKAGSKTEYIIDRQYRGFLNDADGSYSLALAQFRALCLYRLLY